MAETRWLGAAVDIFDVWTDTIALTWAPGDVRTYTINGKDLTLTAGTDITPTQVALALVEMVNGSAQTGTGDHTFSSTGNTVGEFSGITASSVAGVVTLTADVAGIEHTITDSETTAGTGTAVLVHTITATGKNHFDNADNWSAGIPADQDDIVADSGSTDIKYNMAAAIQPATVKITAGYTGNIGLPKVNVDDSSNPYDEYRGDYLTFDLDATQTDTIYDIVGGNGRIKIDVGAGDTITFNVSLSRTITAETDVPAVLLKGTAVDNTLNVLRGSVGVAFFNGETSDLATINVSFLNNRDGDAQVILGDGVDLTNAAIKQTGGTLQIDSTTSSGTINLSGGELVILSGAHASIDIDSGSVFYLSTGTITTTSIGSDGTLDFSRDLNDRTVTTCLLHAGGSIIDPKKTVVGRWTNGIDFVHCGNNDVTLDTGRNVTLTPTAI